MGSISSVLRNKQTIKLLKSPKTAFAIDESTDVSHTSEMIIYVQYVDVECDFEIVLEYFEMVACPGASAKELFDTVTGAVKARGQILFDNWVAFATDGPTVMIGEVNSVTQRLKVIKPYLIDIHCVGHREPLAAKDAFNSIAHCSKLDEVVHACGSFFSHSTQRREELVEIADANNDDNTQVEMCCRTRWLSNSNSTDSIVEKYESVVEQHWNNRGITITSEGLYRKLTDWNIFGGLLHICDVLAKLKRMSLTFQQKQLDGHTVRKAVADLLTAMGAYETGFGTNLRAMVRKIPGYSTAAPGDFTYGGGEGGVKGGFTISFSKSKRDFVEAFAKKLATAVSLRVNERFPLLDIAVAFDVFDRRRFPEAAAAAVRKGFNADAAERKVSRCTLHPTFNFVAPMTHGPRRWNRRLPSMATATSGSSLSISHSCWAKTKTPSYRNSERSRSSLPCVRRANRGRWRTRRCARSAKRSLS